MFLVKEEVTDLKESLKLRYNFTFFFEICYLLEWSYGNLQEGDANWIYYWETGRPQNLHIEILYIEFPTPLLWMALCLLQVQVIHQKPGSLRGQHSVLNVPWIFWSLSPCLVVTDPSVPFTLSSTEAFTPFQIFFQHLVFIEFLVFLLPDVAVSWDCEIYHYHFLLLPTTITYWLLISHHHVIGLDL